MEGKETSDLSRELMEMADLDVYLRENRDVFAERSPAELLTQIYEKQRLSKAELARRAGMSEVYLHQVFSGRRNPSRDRLICICIGMEITLEETQTLLKQATYAQLYPKIKRDAIISYGILHHQSLHKINDRLFLENEKTLF